MSTRVHLYSGLQNLADNREIIEVTGNTVGDCLKSLSQQFPDLKSRLFDLDGKLLPTVMISINLQSQYREELNKILGQGDEIYIILIVPGG